MFVEDEPIVVVAFTSVFLSSPAVKVKRNSPVPDKDRRTEEGSCIIEPALVIVLTGPERSDPRNPVPKEGVSFAIFVLSLEFLSPTGFRRE